MPYIADETRKALTVRSAEVAGELNYLLTMKCIAFLGDKPNYAKFNELIGALECCKLEMYRRMIAPYEDDKRDSNGEVYPC